MTQTMTKDCKVKATWSKIGEYKLPKSVYRVPCTPTTRMVEHLGAVKEKTDGRWNWWRFRSDFHKSWNENFGGADQGVAASQGAAEVRVLEGWNG